MAKSDSVNHSHVVQFKIEARETIESLRGLRRALRGFLNYPLPAELDAGVMKHFHVLIVQAGALFFTGADTVGINHPDLLERTSRMIQALKAMIVMADELEEIGLCPNRLVDNYIDNYGVPFDVEGDVMELRRGEVGS